MGPATPTGLHVDETTASSITWHWNPVEGALGYVVQASMDDTFDDTDTVLFDGLPFTTEDHYTATDLEPETKVYLRVAAAAGTPDAPLLSDFTDPVGGTSAMPPPVPTPFMAEFSVPDDAKAPYPMIPDDDDDEATAMAMVNPQMMVTVNMPAIVSATFVDNAAPIGLIPGPNVPFLYVDWGAMQSMVVTTGVTFAVQAVEIGANQVPLPIGDAMLVTCGPFECMEGPVAPMLSIANSKVCTDWDPEVEIQVGKVDNDVIQADDIADTAADGSVATDGVNGNDGIDLGIVASSSVAMNVKHIFSGVDGGTNTDETVEAAKGSDKTLAMAAVASIHVDADDDDVTTVGIDETMVCDNTYAEEDVSSKADRPAGCFRLRGPGAGGADASKGANYLAGWSIELTPMDADVSWGRVDWEEDPFEDLTCDAMDPIMVADEVDVCGMFEAEVDYATADGWSPTVVFRSETPGFTETTPPTGNEVVMWKATTGPDGGEAYFKTVWFDDNLNGKIKKDKTADLTRGRPMQRNADDSGNVTADDMHDLYNQNDRAENIDAIWEWLTDSNGDLTAGDLGKVDLVSSKDDRDTADDERTIRVESCPSGTSWAPRDGYAQDGTGTTKVDGNLDNTGCKTKAQREGREAGVARTQSTTATAAHPDGNADNYEQVDSGATVTNTAFTEPTTATVNSTSNRTVTAAHRDFFECSEDDTGDDDDGSICDAEWTHDVEVLFADGTFDCSTTRMVTVTCTWDADGGMAQGRNALPDAFTAGDKKFFLKCEAE